jgi:hypothetical protein
MWLRLRAVKIHCRFGLSPSFWFFTFLNWHLLNAPLFHFSADVFDIIERHCFGRELLIDYVNQKLGRHIGCKKIAIQLKKHPLAFWVFPFTELQDQLFGYLHSVNG